MSATNGNDYHAEHPDAGGPRKVPLWPVLLLIGGLLLASWGCPNESDC